MLVKMPRSLLLFEAMLLLGAVLALAYKAAMRVLPLSGAGQQRQKVDPQARILEYYSQYPERYIRIVKESWQYEQKMRCAYHFFTLRNSATVAYHAIEIRLSYESASGKALKYEVVKIPGPLGVLGTLEVRKIQVKGVPAASEKVAASVITAQIVH